MSTYLAVLLATQLWLISSPIARSEESLAGCYRMQFSPWRPDLKLGADKQFITPPKAIELTKELGSPWDSKGYLVRAMPGAENKLRHDAWWVRTNGGAEIHFTDGYVGFDVELSVGEPGTLHGVASTHWDFGRAVQTASVAITAVPCLGDEG